MRLRGRRRGRRQASPRAAPTVAAGRVSARVGPQAETRCCRAAREDEDDARASAVSVSAPETPVVRAARPADADAIAAVHRAAFAAESAGEPEGTEVAEVRLVAELVAAGLDRVSVVAEVAGRVVGHILFSELTLAPAGGPAVLGLALAPLAVLPTHQRHGIGAALCRAGLALARERGHHRVIVLGDPDYYGRFGFRSAPASEMRAPWTGPALQALALTPNAFDGLERATLRYPEAFARI